MTLAIILVSKSLYFESYGENALLAPTLIFAFIAFPASKKSLLDKRLLLWIFGFSILVCLNPETQKSSLLVLVIRMAIALWFVSRVSFRDFAISFERIILGISLVSLLSLLVIAIDVPSPLPNFIGIDSRHLRNFIVFGVSQNFIDLKVFRNSGLWWEPGAFQIFVNLSALFSIHLQKMDMKKFVLYLIVIASTQSTTGIIVFFLLSILYLSQRSASSMSFASKAVITLIVPLAMLIAWPLLMDKFDLESASVVSFLSRFYDIQVSYNMFTENFWRGYGFGSQIQNAIPYAERMLGTFICSSPAKPTGADGITMLIAQCGIFSFPFILPFLWPSYLRSYSIFQRALVALALFFLFNTENLTFTLLFMILSFYAVVSHQTPQPSEPNESSHLS